MKRPASPFQPVRPVDLYPLSWVDHVAFWLTVAIAIGAVFAFFYGTGAFAAPAAVDFITLNGTQSQYVNSSTMQPLFGEVGIGSVVLSDGGSGNLDLNGGSISSQGLPDGQIWIGNPSNIATPTTLTGNVTVSDTGVTLIGAGVVTNSMVASGAAIAYSKLNLSSSILNSDIGSTTFSVAHGGTNSSTALSNERVMVSVSGAIVEAAAITANSAVVSDSNGLPTTGGATATEVSYLSGVTSAIQTQLNGKQSAGSYITALTSDVTATGPGSVAATVNSVGGSSAANIHSAELAANAATSADTASTIVLRDPSGNIAVSGLTATSITGLTTALSTAQGGTGVSGSATFPTTGTVDTIAGSNTLTNHTINGASNTLTVLAGTQLSGQAPVGNGGTGAATLALDGILYGNGTSAVQVTAAPSQYNVLVGNVSGVPVFGQVNLAQTAGVTGTLGVGNGGLGSAATPTNGQIPIGNGSTYTAATITGTTNEVNVANASGSITLSTPQAIATTSSPTFAGVVFSGSGSGTTTVQASATASGTLTLPAATDTLADLAGTQTLTNKTISALSNTITSLVAEYDFTGDGSTTAFTLTGQNLVAADAVLGYVDGRLEQNTVSYTRTNANPGIITFAAAPDSGSWVHVVVVNE